MHSLFTHILFTRSLFPQAWLLAAAILATSTVPSNIYADPPNVVIAFADDFGRHLSAYAALEPGGLNDFIKTPNIDRIAKEGVLCTRAYVNAPSCTPCRSSFLSGQYFWRTGRGAILSGAVWDSSIPTFPLLLEAAGYHIGHSHKVWSPEHRPMRRSVANEPLSFPQVDNLMISPKP